MTWYNWLKKCSILENPVWSVDYNFDHHTSGVYIQLFDLLLPVLSLLKGGVSSFGVCKEWWHVDSM